MSKGKAILRCTNCGFQASKEELDRTCSNCFACTGCEIYICPECREEIVVKPIKPMSSGNKKRRTV